MRSHVTDPSVLERKYATKVILGTFWCYTYVLIDHLFGRANLVPLERDKVEQMELMLEREYSQVYGRLSIWSFSNDLLNDESIPFKITNILLQGRGGNLRQILPYTRR